MHCVSIGDGIEYDYKIRLEFRFSLIKIVVYILFAIKGVSSEMFGTYTVTLFDATHLLFYQSNHFIYKYLKVK